MSSPSAFLDNLPPGVTDGDIQQRFDPVRCCEICKEEIRHYEPSEERSNGGVMCLDCSQYESEET